MCHSLIKFALDWYGVPSHLTDLVSSYYDGLKVAVSTEQFTTDFVDYLKGVFQGCTASPVLFDVVFQMLLDCLSMPQFQQEAYAFFSDPTLRLLVAAFADDLQG